MFKGINLKGYRYFKFMPKGGLRETMGKISGGDETR